MTNIEPPISKPFYDKLLSSAVNQEQIEKIRNYYSEAQVSRENKKGIEFCREFSREWIVDTLNSQEVDKAEIDEKRRLVSLSEGISMNESDAQIYSYLLFFCGVSFLLSGKGEEDKKHRKALTKFFELQIHHTKDRNKKLLFRFSKVLVDLVDPEKEEDIIVFRDL